MRLLDTVLFSASLYATAASIRGREGGLGGKRRPRFPFQVLATPGPRLRPRAFHYNHWPEEIHLDDSGALPSRTPSASSPRLSRIQNCCVLFAAFLLFAALPLTAQDGPRYPRIANLYGAGLSWVDAEKGLPYWSKLGLIAGGGSDWHFDYQAKGPAAATVKAAAKVRLIRQSNPHLIALPYFDVIEGPDDPAVPATYWLKGSDGLPVSTWPGMRRVDTANPAVLEATAKAVERLAFADQAWNGAFLDCWSPDPVLTPMLRTKAPGAVLMTNPWNLPDTVDPKVNGVLGEDELNRAASGLVDVRDLMDRYHRWMRDSAKPAVTTLSAYPRTIDPDPWRWNALSPAERKSIIDAGQTGDLAMLRFGLCFTLMDDGYFAYDAGTQARGQWWWYPEFDAPVGTPEGGSVEVRPALWKREYSGASVWVNGSDYDEPVHFDRPMKDSSTGRIARDFVLSRIDGRIFVPAELPGGLSDNGIAASQARFLRSGSSRVESESGLDGGSRWQFPSGLELFLDPKGLLDRVSWKGRTILTGGHPVIVLPEWREIAAKSRSSGSFEGTVGWADGGDGDFLRDSYQISTGQRPDGSVFLKLRDSFVALEAKELKMWRQYLFLPVSEWAGKNASISVSGADFSLPAALGVTELGRGRMLTLDHDDFRLEIRTNVDFGLVDHRRYGTKDYLWAGYPSSNHLEKGSSRTVELEILITPKLLP